MKKIINLSAKLISVILTIVLVTMSLCLPVLAAEDESFSYRHDPTLNASAMNDIIADSSAVYGFRPSETGSLKNYASLDWSDKEIIAKGRLERIAYHESLEAMYGLLEEMRKEGSSTEDIARAVSSKRNELRIEACKDNPDELSILKERNLEKYGHEEGPLPDELYEKYGSWEKVIEKAFSANAGMDACLGLYDRNYQLYVSSGMVEDDHIDDDRLPAKLDLRNYNGYNYVTPVKMQNPFGTCWAFAAIATAETSFLYTNSLGVPAGEKNDKVNFSEKQLDSVKEKLKMFKQYCVPLELKIRHPEVTVPKPGRRYGDAGEFLVQFLGAKIYTVVDGSFKSYFGVNTNCVMFADWLLSDTGIDAVSMGGLRTPGAFYYMLENMFYRPNNRIIRKISYFSTDGIEEKIKLGSNVEFDITK